MYVCQGYELRVVYASAIVDRLSVICLKMFKLCVRDKELILYKTVFCVFLYKTVYNHVYLVSIVSWYVDFPYHICQPFLYNCKYDVTKYLGGWVLI